MVRHPQQAKLRERLQKVATRIAAVVADPSERNGLGREALTAIGRLLPLVAGGVDGPHHAYFDRGFFEHGSVVGTLEGVEVHPEQDSVEVLGIQLADLNAHFAATMIRERLSQKKKMVHLGDDFGYDPTVPTELEFELFARTRHRWFHGPPPQPAHLEDFDQFVHMVVPVLGYGLFITPGVSEHMREAARRQLGSMYLGCIH